MTKTLYQCTEEWACEDVLTPEAPVTLVTLRVWEWRKGRGTIRPVKIWKQAEGYDAWGVRLPSGYVREFTSEDSARAYMRRMEGQHVIDISGELHVWNGLTVVHRYMPPWEEVDQ